MYTCILYKYCKRICVFHMCICDYICKNICLYAYMYSHIWPKMQLLQPITNFLEVVATRSAEALHDLFHFGIPRVQSQKLYQQPRKHKLNFKVLSGNHYSNETSPSMALRRPTSQFLSSKKLADHGFAPAFRVSLLIWWTSKSIGSKTNKFRHEVAKSKNFCGSICV